MKTENKQKSLKAAGGTNSCTRKEGMTNGWPNQKQWKPEPRDMVSVLKRKQQELCI